jgi:hypothetical protein
MANESNMLEKALLYLGLGWSVIPVNLSYNGDNVTKANKKPMIAWAQYQDRYPSEEEVIDSWTKWPQAGIGIITGAISGLVVLDLDVGYDPQKIADLNLPETATVNTPSGGQHLYFKHPGYAIANRTDLFGNGSHVDVRGDGGYVVVPPTLYPNMVPYEWSKNMQEIPIAALPQNLADLMLKKEPAKGLAEAVGELFKGVPEGNRNSEAARICGILLKKHPKVVWAAEVWPKLKSWNEMNTPPLDETELRNVYESISKREIDPPSELMTELEDAIILKDLIGKSFGLPNWVVSHLFETGTVNMISAAPHQYKSWVVHHMALCVAAGKSVFNHLSVTRQKVMIVNEEDTERQLKERSLMLLDGDTDLPVYFHVAKGIKIDDAFVERILPELKRQNITFLVLDSLRSLHNADENSSKDMQVIMDQFKRLTKENITILFTHHNRKKFHGFNSDNDQGGSEESRGSSSINAAVHGHISCEPKKDGDQKYLIITQHKLKSEEAMKPMKILIQKDEENNKLSLIYDGEYSGKVESRNKVGEEVLAELISGGWMSIKDLSASNRDLGAERVIREALRVLVSQNRVVCKSRKELAVDGIILPEGKGSELFYSLPITQSYVDEGY